MIKKKAINVLSKGKACSKPSVNLKWGKEPENFDADSLELLILEKGVL